MSGVLGNVVCITQARFGSSRLPGKVLMEAAGKPLLAHHLERLKRATLVDRVALATSENPQDDPVAMLGESLGVAVFRGSENDVLSRFAGCARWLEADTVVRVTADCPLIDPTLIDRALTALAGDPAVDYVNIDTERFPRGLDAEAFRAPLLFAAEAEATDPVEREHVTPFIYRRPKRFHLGRPVVPETPVPTLRWCVDEPADMELIRRMLDALPGGNFDWRDCRDLIARNPRWAEINRAVAQRKP